MNIEKFCNNYNLGKVEDISKLTGGLVHKMFKVVTDKETYCIKVLNPSIMSRETAYSNFVTSEKISNLAKKYGIPVSSALDINGDYLTKFENNYYMVFEFVSGNILKDDEITIDHCKKIGDILANLHSLNYKEIGLEPNFVKYKNVYDWEGYANNPNIDNMSYKEIYLKNYKDYYEMLKLANEKFNSSNIVQTICHRDMDPKNVLWNNNEPIIIDWESSGMANPYRELLEDALCWSGFLSCNFKEERFKAVFQEYTNYRSIDNINWSDVIYGNLVGRFGWLKYNLERSLGIVSNEKEEIELAQDQVIRTIDEIKRYIELIDTMKNIIDNLR